MATLIPTIIVVIVATTTTIPNIQLSIRNILLPTNQASIRAILRISQTLWSGVDLLFVVVDNRRMRDDKYLSRLLGLRQM